MSTQLHDGTLAAGFNASGLRGVDPRRRRFALNPGIYLAMLGARESGRQEILLPVGLVVFRTTQMDGDDFDHALKNGNNPDARGKQILQDFTAHYFLSNALIRYGEMGMQELSSLTFMDDPQPNDKGNITKEQFNKSAQGYFAALYPSFEDIDHQCPADLNECVTCRLQLLGDPAEGIPMDQRIADRLARLEDQKKVAELRVEVVASEKGYLNWCTAKWADVVGEMADRKGGKAPGIAKLGVAEHHVRRNLHEVEPSEAATAAGFGMEVAQANADATRELASAFREGKATDNTEILKLVVQRQNKTDAALEALATSIKTLVDRETKE